MRARGKALLLGNGINRAAALQPSWEDIVRALFELSPSKEFDVRMKATPFPLLIEEAASPPFAHAGERKVQRGLVRQLEEWEPAPIHKEVLSLDVEHILTTNYDLMLERASGERFDTVPPFIQETRYSLFRRYRLADGKKVWHVHGSVASPKTMVLGFEHYSGHLQAMREVVVSRRHYKHKSYGPLKQMIARNPARHPQSWVEVALTHNLLIVGLSLDFAELGFWWLLTYRARRRNLGKGKLPDTQIVFVTRKPDLDSDGKHRARRVQLENCGVKVFEEDCEWSAIYERAFSLFRELPKT